MAVKVVATGCPSLPHSPCSSKRALNDVVTLCRNPFLGMTSSKLSSSRSAEFKPKQRASHCGMRRSCSASFNEFSDNEFLQEIEELSRRLQFSDAGDNSGDELLSIESRWPEIPPKPSDWGASIEMKANRVDLPVSLRMIKQKKKQLQGGFIEARESAYCSIKKAFSSMVFIIRELHSFTLQMRELLFYEDMQGILERVKSEIHTSFVWLFQQVFSHTPTLMVYVMILLANFTVDSMSASPAIAAVARPPATVEESQIVSTSTNADSSTIIKSYSASSSSKTTSVGGGNGGGSNTRPTASGTEGDGWTNRPANLNRPILPEIAPPSTTPEEDKEETEAWNSMVEEPTRMQEEEGRGEVLSDHETLQRLVSPLTAKVDAAGEEQDYTRTEIQYQVALEQDPNNVLLLANYAQFLYLVTRDYDRAEEYFKRAIKVEPKDAEAHSKYAHFLWQVRNDLWAAEETFLEAISADPTNSYYTANYAHFLWNTGGEDTCFPLGSPADDDHDNCSRETTMDA